MTPVVVRHNPRADLATIDRFAPLGVSTTHEASGRAPKVRPSSTSRRWADAGNAWKARMAAKT